jgi:23S rRNA (uracil1939-C5)-methyltransferase
MNICKHFGDCGGCRLQDIPYKEQLATKEKSIAELAFVSDLDTQIKPINSFEPYYYRNKMEFSFANQDGLVCGLYSSKDKGKVVDIKECLIFSPDTGSILSAIRDFLKSKKYSVYNKYSHKGFLRNLIIRETKFTKELMIGLVTTSEEELDKDKFIEVILSLKLASRIKSIFWIINNSFSDAVIFEEKRLLYGETFIKEELDNLTFKIGIDTFFQVNPKMVQGFYKKIRDYVKLTGKEEVLDLFCGVGSIGLFLAKDAKIIWGVEVIEEIVDIAKQNAKINNIDNISFFTSDARKFLNIEGAPSDNIDLLILNPPRGGLSNKIIRAVLRLRPKSILYSSCNPKALARDLKGLIAEYNLEFIEPFDFFPHTPHLECLSLLRTN